MTDTPPAPTCCRDALFNWAVHYQVPGDLTEQGRELPGFCDAHRR